MTSRTNIARLQVIIDTDAGIDDAVAILTILRSTNCECKAITTVDGNSSLDNCTANVATILALDFERYGHIPIFPGARGPLIQPEDFSKTTYYLHGKDGLGDSRHLYQQEIGSDIAKIRVHWDEHAAVALVRMCKANPGMTLVALGPLTNIAMAIRLDPDFLSYIDRLHIMGGSLLAKGNISRSSEFNFNSDPEAAHIVFTASTRFAKQNPSAQPKLVLSPWELCLETAFEWSFIVKLMQSEHKWATFLKRITSIGSVERSKFEAAKREAQLLDELASQTIASPPRHNIYHPEWLTEQKKSLSHLHYISLCDSTATLPLVIPECVKSTFSGHVEIELQGKYGRGMLAIEWYQHLSAGLPHNVEILTILDQGMLDRQLAATFAP